MFFFLRNTDLEWSLPLKGSLFASDRCLRSLAIWNNLNSVLGTETELGCSPVWDCLAVVLLLLLLFSCQVMSDSLQSHELQHGSLPCPLPPPSLLKFMFIESVMLSNHLILCHSPSPFALNLFQQQGLFQRVGSSHQVAKVLEHPLQHQSFQWIFRVDFL